MKCTLNEVDSSFFCNKLSFTRFVWNFRKADEATNYITSYNYDPTKPGAKDPSVSELFFQALQVQEYPDEAQEIIEHPFPGLVNSALVSEKFHNSRICISFRVPAMDDSEIESESTALQIMDASHFPFIVPEGETRHNTGRNAANVDHEIMLNAAAKEVAMWLSEGADKMGEMGNVAVPVGLKAAHIKRI